MRLEPSDQEKGLKTPVWDEYKVILDRAEKNSVSMLCM